MATTTAIKIKTQLPNDKVVTNTYSANGKMKINLDNTEVKTFVTGVDLIQLGNATNAYVVTTKEVDIDG